MRVSSAASGTECTVRRRPAQARSRERFEQVLDAAGSLVVERGLEPVTVTDIAERAGMATAAVYRYFPSKQAIVRELALRTFDTDAELTAGFAADRALPVGDWLVGAVEQYCHHHLRDPLRLQVRAAIQADAELSALDLDDSRRNAAIIVAALRRAGVDVPIDDLNRRVLVLVELTDALIRLAARTDRVEADALIKEFAGSVRRWVLRED